MQVKGSVAVIIGGAQGIGKAIVEKLLQLGAMVAFGDNDEDLGTATMKEFQEKYGEEHVLFQKCDITQKKDIQGLLEATISRWGQIDIFSPVAGIQDENKWEATIDINLTGGIQSVQEVMKHMSKEEGGKGGVIILISSQQAYWIFPFAPTYRGTKAALMCYAQAMAADEIFAHHGIRFNILCPGAIPTRMAQRLMLETGEGWLYPEEGKEFVWKSFDKDCWTDASSVAAGFVRFVEDETTRGQTVVVEREGGNDVIKKLTFNVTSEVLETITKK